MACSAGCPTKDCPSYGACLRQKRLQIDTLALNQEKSDVLRSNTRELDYYEKVRRDGMQPAGTKTRDIDFAVKATKKTGVAYRDGEV